VSRKRLQIDWVTTLINTTLFIAVVMFVAVVGFVVWVVRWVRFKLRGRPHWLVEHPDAASSVIDPKTKVIGEELPMTVTDIPSG
jgi:hypothetical protein